MEDVAQPPSTDFDDLCRVVFRRRWQVDRESFDLRSNTAEGGCATRDLYLVTPKKR
jgi:hypothetical protein